MFFSPFTFLLLWILFSLLFLIFIFLTLSALGKQTRFKLRLSITIVSFILGIACFFGIFSDHSVEKDWKQLTTKHTFPSIPQSLSNLFKQDDASKQTTKTETNHNDEKETTSQSNNQDSKTKTHKVLDYDTKSNVLPKDFNPTSNSGKPVTVDAGTYKVGKQIQPGFYHISTKSKDIGTLELKNQYGTMTFIEVLSGPKKSSKNSITTYLAKDQTITIKKMDQVQFEPEKHIKRQSLTTGLWIVGPDITPGTYTLKQTDKYGSNNLFIKDASNRMKTNEIIGGSSKHSKSSLKVKFDKGDRVIIQGSGKVELK